VTDTKDPLESPVSKEASNKALDVASKLLNEVAEDHEWEKIMGLVVGNLMGHALTMIQRHRGYEAAMKWHRQMMSVTEQHMKGEPDGTKSP
jgi:hypothetical protein